MSIISDYPELDMTAMNVDYVQPRRSILTANYGSGYRDTAVIDASGGTKTFQISAGGVWVDDVLIDKVGAVSAFEYYWTFFEARLDAGNQPFVISWRGRKWLVDLAEPEHGVECHTSNLFTPDGIELRQRRVKGLYTRADGSLFDPSQAAGGIYGWYTNGENVPGPFGLAWSDRLGINPITTVTGNVVGAANQINGLGAAQFNLGATNNGFLSTGTVIVFEAFFLMKMRESTFSNFGGILTANTGAAALIGDASKTIFFNLGLGSSYIFKKNGIVFPETDLQAPMNTWGVVHLRFSGGIGLVNLQIGKDRDFTNRFAEVDIAEIVLCNSLLSTADALDMDNYLKLRGAIA